MMVCWWPLLRPKRKFRIKSLFSALALFLCATGLPLRAQEASPSPYLFVWSGDVAGKSSDFLAVIDADPASSHYGQPVASIVAPGPSGHAHHTEMEMSGSGFLFANSYRTGRTMLFDLRDPLHPALATSFGELNGFMHPHTYVRLSDGNVLATFQYHGGMTPKSAGGGLVEFDEKATVLKSGSAMDMDKDPQMKNELIRPYSVLVIPGTDRLVSTNHSMMSGVDGHSRTIQLWRSSDLKLLNTLPLPTGPRGYEQLEPGEPRLLSDRKTVLIHTFNCGLYELKGVASDQPTVRYLKTFEGAECGVPLRIGHYWIQTLSSAHALASFDISDLDSIHEISRITFDDQQWPHWISADTGCRRLVIDSGGYGADTIYFVKFDPQTGALKVDQNFRDTGSSQPGVSLDGKTWPHGFHGDAFPHGAVFSNSAPACDIGIR